MPRNEIFDGRDMFDRRVIGVRGKSGSVILSIPEAATQNDDGDDVYPTMSLTAESCAALRTWLEDEDDRA